MAVTNMQVNNNFLDKMPPCHCGSGEKIMFICLKEECAYFKALNNRMSYKRYYCETCMEKDHDHLPTKILKKVGEIQDRWIDLDQKLHNIENDFFTKMKDFAPLLSHF